MHACAVSAGAYAALTRPPQTANAILASSKNVMQEMKEKNYEKMRYDPSTLPRLIGSFYLVRCWWPFLPPLPIMFPDERRFR